MRNKITLGYRHIVQFFLVTILIRNQNLFLSKYSKEDILQHFALVITLTYLIGQILSLAHLKQ